MGYLSFSPLIYNGEVTESTWPWATDIKKNPRYTNCRYLVVYQILKVSNLSLHFCGRDAIGTFFGGGVTWPDLVTWPWVTWTYNFQESCGTVVRTAVQKRWRCTGWLKHITGSKKKNVQPIPKQHGRKCGAHEETWVSKHRYYFLRWLKVTPSYNIWGLLWYINTTFFIGDWMLWGNSKGVATKFWLGGVGFIGTQTHLPQNLVSPWTSATLFWKCWKMQKKTFQEKSYWNIQISGGRPPLFLNVRGSWPPRPPSVTPLRNRASRRGGQVSRPACLGRPRAPWPGSGHSGPPTATCSKLHWRGGAGRFGQMKSMVHVQKSTQNSLLAKTKYTHLYESTYLYVFKKCNFF